MHCELYIPDFFPPEGLPRADSLAAAETLIARGRRRRRSLVSPEAWLFGRFDVARQRDWPVAPYTLLADGEAPGPHYWMRADPVHLQLGRDSLGLTDSAAFHVSRAESEALVVALNRHFGRTMLFHPLRPARWYVRIEKAPDMQTTPAAAARGAAIDDKLPSGPDAMRFHALMNEAQMLLHEHPVNAEREARGEPALNSVWFWGGGIIDSARGRPFSTVFGDDQLVREGLHPVLARVCAARGIRGRKELKDALSGLLPPSGLLGAERAALLLADAIAASKRMLIVADYDCDGATACALGVRALAAFGASVGYLVPNRFEFGYGLTPEVVALAAQSKPDLLITVDNGIASVEGVEAARRLGIEVIVTDHHLPGAELPRAAAIVNPNQPGCAFPSKSLAGVGVMFYVMLALRAELRKRGAFAGGEEPNLGDALDLLALGTVADVVPLDFNNRVLVAQGLKRIRAGRMQEGVRALFAVAGHDPSRASAFDLGFLLGPRLNAAGRLSDMSLGIECLITADRGRALEIARQLDELNDERRAIEADMRLQADELLAKLDIGESSSISLYDPSWHQGVIGILAGRVKDRYHRPTFAFAQGAPGEIKGSGRSIAGLHLRDALDLVAKRAPGQW